MPSIIDGFEYDVFISYRHKDNEYDGWVTEFVNNLKKELRATLKEDVSIYFDTNPHDGLLESHIVSKSLEGKLNCLIFIPIISQTYGDLKSYAWQSEFKSFNQTAKKDRFGRDIRLPNGNFSSRILPVRIHELDPGDKSLFENEIGGPLRSIDFIYRSAGVNRPLRSHEDHPQDNLNKIYYRDQINKVANAIKEIVSVLGANGTGGEPKAAGMHPKTSNKIQRIAIAAFGLLLLFVAGYFLWAEKIGRETVNTHHSIAVLPFTNMSNDPNQEFFSDGITEQIITNLAQLKDLRVMARTSVMKYKNKTTSIAEIGRELNVTHILEGSVRRSGDTIRITAQLIAVADEFHLWADVYDKRLIADVLRVQDEVSTKIATSLKNKLLPEEREKLTSLKPSNPEAYGHFLKAEYIHGNYYFRKYLEEDFRRSESEYLKAIQLDSGYATAYAGLANLYDTHYNADGMSSDEREKYRALRELYTQKATVLAPQLPMVKLLRYYSHRDTPDSAYYYGRIAYEAAPNSAGICQEFGDFFTRMGLFETAEKLFRQSAAISPGGPFNHTMIGIIQFAYGHVDSAKVQLRKAELLDSSSIMTLNFIAALKIHEKKMNEAEYYIEKVKRINPEGVFPFVEARLLAAKGQKEKALEINKDPLVYLALGMKREALDQVERSTTDNNYLNLKNSPLWNDLRSEPRFNQILSKKKVEYEARLSKYPF